MPMPNLDPSFELGKRLSGMEQRIRSMETKVSQLTMATGSGSSQGFALPVFPGSYGAVPSLAVATLTIPQGFTTAYITALGSITASCQPPTQTSDWMISYVWISTTSPGQGPTNSAGLVTYGTANGSGGNATPVPFVSQYPNWAGIWTGLTGGTTITASIKAYTNSGWSLGSVNTAGMGFSVIFVP